MKRRFLTFQVWMTEQEANCLRRILEAHGNNPATPIRDAERMLGVLRSMNEAWDQANQEHRGVGGQ